MIRLNANSTLLAAIASVSLQAQAGVCANSVQQQIENQGQIDFPGQNLHAQMPEIDESGGAVDKYLIPMLNGAGRKVAICEILVNETCSVISAGLK